MESNEKTEPTSKTETGSEIARNGRIEQKGKGLMDLDTSVVIAGGRRI